MSVFTKAARKKAKLRLALCGPSGSGKTMGALKIAKGIGGKVALIDTEGGSGELYSNLFDYDICTLTNFSPKDYINLIRDAEKNGYEILIIDSLSHAWAGKGGILEKADNVTASSNSKNSFAAWRQVTPEHNSLVDAIVQSKLHIIVTMRTKTAYDLQENDKGRKVPVKIGLAPVQREGLEYEFTTVFDMSIDKHYASASKDRTSIFVDDPHIISEETGEKFKVWLDDGIDEEEEKKKLLSEFADLLNLHVDGQAVWESLQKKHSINEPDELSFSYVKSYCDKLRDAIDNNGKRKPEKTEPLPEPEFNDADVPF